MGNMRSALPMSQVPAGPPPQLQQNPLAGWASDFVQQQPMQRSAPREVHQDQAFQHSGATPINSQRRSLHAAFGSVLMFLYQRSRNGRLLDRIFI